MKKQDDEKNQDDERYLLSPEDARALLDRECGGIGHGVIARALRIDKSTLWRYLKREMTFPRDTQIAIWCLCHDPDLLADATSVTLLKRRDILKKLFVVRLTGYGAGEVERGRGGVFHAMERFDEFGHALCNKRPGSQSGGWCQVNVSVNCPRCLKLIDESPLTPKKPNPPTSQQP